MTRRRWFRFSLRTLFVVVTVLGCRLGYQLNWIRQRAAVRDGHEAILYQTYPAGPFKTLIHKIGFGRVLK